MGRTGGHESVLMGRTGGHESGPDGRNWWS